MRDHQGRDKIKLFYFHVPKTAGSSINEFFASHTKRYHFHIEGIKDIDNDFFNSYQFLSGHMSYDRINRLIDLKEWTTFATFRDPLSHTISHLKWVRKLADPGEEERLKAHPEVFQKIALKMLEYDFAIPEQITAFIAWLESINFFYFHNTQLHYMNVVKRKRRLTEKQLNSALHNMKKIDYIGIQENMNEFMEMISYEFGWEFEKAPKVNVNDNHYGFNKNNPETQKALLPLYEQDLILYREAKKQYQKTYALYVKKPMDHVKGFVDKSNKNIIGWARFNESLRKVDLELRYKGEVLQTTKANIFRKGLKLKKIHPTGLSGFRFLVNDNLDRKACKVYIKGTDIALLSS